MRTRSILIMALLVAGSSHARAQTPAPSADKPAPPPEPSPTPAVTVTTPAPASSATRPWSFGVALRVGLDVPTAKLGLMAGGDLELDAALPVADHRLVLALGFGLTRPSHDGTVTDARVGGMQTYTVSETELAVGLDAVFRVFPADKKLVPWLGAGPLLQMLKTSETSSIAPGTNTEQSTKVGVEAAAGVDLRAGPGYALGELRYRYSSLDHALTGSSNAGNVVLSLGYRVVF